MAPPDRPDLFRPRDNEPGDGASHASGPAVGASAGRGAEELLREVEARYRYVVDTQTELICRFLPDTTLTFVNDAYCRFFGRTREALLGSPFVDLLPAAHRDDVRARIAAQVRQPRIETYEHDVLLPGGTVGRQEWTDQPILDAAGRLVEIQAMGRDVTQQRRTEAALRESEARLRLALENAAMGTWSWDVPNQMVIWSEHVGPLYGLPRGTAGISSETFFSIVHPDDRERVREADRASIAGGNDYAVEFRVVRPDGTVRWLEGRGKVTERDATGRATRLLGVTIDVTERKEAEAALRASEARFRSLIANASDLVTILDADGVICYESPAIARVLGHDPAALVGRRAFDLVHPDDRAPVEADFAALVADPALNPMVTFRFRHADGSWRWLEGTGTNLLDDPAVAGVVVNSRDVTEQRSAADALREREREARELLAAADRQAREAALLDRARSALARELDLPVLFRTVVEAVAETFGYTQVSLYLLEGDVLVLQHQVGYDRVIERVPVAVGISGRVVRTGRPVLLEDAHADPVFLAAIEGIESEVCVPLRDQGKVVGTLNLESTNGVRLGEADLRLMIALGEHVDVAIGRARLYAEVRASEERFRAFMDHTPVLAWIKDEAGRFAYVNRAFAQVFDAAAADLVGKTDGDILPAELAPVVQREDRLISERGLPLDAAHSLTAPAVDRREWLAYKFPLVDAGGGRFVGGTAVDITARAQTEAALREAAAAAAAANRAKSQFLSTVSHELRTPLNTITGYAHLLLDGLAGPLRPEQAADVGQIAASADHLLALINDVLDLSRIEADRLDLSLEKVDVAALVEEVRAGLAREAAAKGLRLEVDAPAGLAVVADPLRVRQILVNLVGNAVKFTERGRVAIAARAAPEGVEVAVRDTGIGIAPAVLPHVFDHFRQADGSTTRRYGGTGLGLSISRRLADLHGGTIAVESEPGAGSTFTLRLPAQPPAAEDRA